MNMSGKEGQGRRETVYQEGQNLPRHSSRESCGTQSQIFTFSFLAVPHNLTLALANFSSQHHEAFLDTSVKCIHVRACEGWMTSSCKWENHVFSRETVKALMNIICQ